jgi:hypothetical protein
MLCEGSLKIPVSLLDYLYPNQDDWNSLAFGVLGGVDIGCFIYNPRHHPIRMSIRTERTSLQLFCSLAQLAYFEKKIANKDELNHCLEQLRFYYQNILIVAGKIVYIVEGTDLESLVPITGMDSSVVKGDEFFAEGSFQLIAYDDEHKISKKELLLLALASNIAHYHNSDGVSMQCRNWLNQLRRPSVRNSWPKLLEERENYFWMSKQMHRQILSMGDIAFRETFITFLRGVSTEFELPILNKIALQFRSSSEQWNRLAFALIGADNSLLENGSDAQLEQFIKENSTLDISMRIQVIDITLQRILTIEKQAFAELREAIHTLSLSVA